MDSRNHKDESKLVSSLIHDPQVDRTQVSRILARESSVGQSSRIYYSRKADQGVPFQWEMQPGTPKNPQKEDVIPPLSPPPSVQNLGLPKPCFINNTEHDEHQESKRLKVWLSKRIKKLKTLRKSHQNSELESDGEFVGSSFKNSSSSSFSSSTDSFSSRNQDQREKSARIRRDMMMMEDTYSCCTPMDKEEANVIYSKMHRRAFSSEEDDHDDTLSHCKIISRMSSADQLSASHSYYRTTEGIPFKWEMQPGTPKNNPQQENEDIIPPPSPPPKIQSLSLPKPSINMNDHQLEETKRSTWERLLSLVKTKRMNIKRDDESTIKQREAARVINNNINELSFRLQGSFDHRGRHGDSVLLSSSLSSILKKKGLLPFSKIRIDVLGGNFCFNPCKVKANLADSSSSRRN